MKRVWCLMCGDLTLALGLKLCPYCGFPLGKRVYTNATKWAYNQGIGRAKAVQKEREADE